MGWTEAAALVGSGLAIGLGAAGSAVGSGYIAGQSLAGSARNPARSGRSLQTMLIAQALCQTPVVFALVISLILWVQKTTFAGNGPASDVKVAAALLGAGACMGFGAIGPALGTGFVGGVAARETALRPRGESVMTRAFFVGAAVSQTTSIYALVIALLLVFWAAA
jgi:F0F1-type ATP synthase membrane subunit c/vacuolar-type H+-ATPase subunit K